MVRSLDDTKVGEYKNSWFFQLVQLLISILGCVAVFLLPITYISDASGGLDGQSPIIYLFSNPSNEYARILSVLIVIFFGFILLNIFAILAVPSVSKSVYVRVSKVIEGILAAGCLAMLAYYMVYLFNHSLINMGNAELMYKVVLMYIGIVGFALVNSVFVYFTSKKVSIYD